MTLCAQCQSVPTPLSNDGTLILVGLDPEQIEALTSCVEVYGIVPTSVGEGMLSVSLFDGCFQIVLDWSRLVSERLVAEGRYLLLERGEELGLSHLAKVRPLSDLLKSLKNAWVLEMIRENRLVSYYHPIVNAGEPDVIHAHECLMRGVAEDGKIVSPGQVLDAADEEGLMFHLDRACRINAIKGFAGENVAGKAFINFNPVSVYNPVACLQSTVAAARSVGLRPERVVFELIERNHVADEAHLLRIVDFYRAAGYGVALDDVGAGYSGLNLLSSLKPDYIKLDMHLIRDVDKDPVRQSIVGNMLEMARKLGILSVVEGVETCEEYEFARAEGADFVQGYLFAKPAPRAVEADLPLLAA
ncbi:EAL domain-containing protein [bacterium]|nr:MAG: EAL domain-containing protein [bacterium]